ncbi:MAG TPA: hypothetical protein VG099_24530 [Gemmataceae bacterium]|nr:hypothetical protein [Gemmataceae bacterium]
MFRPLARTGLVLVLTILLAVPLQPSSLAITRPTVSKPVSKPVNPVTHPAPNPAIHAAPRPPILSRPEPVVRPAGKPPVHPASKPAVHPTSKPVVHPGTKPAVPGSAPAAHASPGAHSHPPMHHHHPPGTMVRSHTWEHHRHLHARSIYTVHVRSRRWHGRQFISYAAARTYYHYLGLRHFDRRLNNLGGIWVVRFRTHHSLVYGRYASHHIAHRVQAALQRFGFAAWVRRHHFYFWA